MVCTCDTRMKCTFSVPVARRYRYRQYVCHGCGLPLETLEVPSYLVGGSPALHKMLTHGRRRARGLFKSLRGKATPIE